MKAIKVSYLPYTGRSGPRLLARDSDGNRATVPLPVEVSGGREAEHFEAVKALCAKMGWEGEVTCGWFAGDSYWAFADNRQGNVYLLPKVAERRAA